MTNNAAKALELLEAYLLSEAADEQGEVEASDGYDEWAAGRASAFTVAAEKIAELRASIAKQRGDQLDTGNLVHDPLYLALDALYERGWRDGEKSKFDPRGTIQWGDVLTMFRLNRAAPQPTAEGDAT